MKGIERCESPIERMLVDALARQSRFEWREAEDPDCEIGTWPGWWIVLLSQVPLGPYRPDLLLTSVFPEDGQSMPWLVVVEVDGHDFHEKTREQAARDKQRDRFFATRGATVIRYTGSEIYRDADRCANEAIWCAARKQQEHLTPAFLRFMKARGTITERQHYQLLGGA